MDSYTLMITTCLTAATMALTFFGLAAASRRETYLLLWGCAGTLFFANSLLATLAFHFDVPFWLTPALANLCTALGYGFLLAGLRLYLRRTFAPIWLVALAALTVSVHLHPWTQDSVNHRLLLMFPILIGLQLSIVLLLLRNRQRQLKVVFTTLAMVISVNATQMLFRWCYLLLPDSPDLTFLGNQLLQTFGRLAMFTFLLLATFACALLVIRRQELILRQQSDTDPLTGCYNRRALNRLLTDLTFGPHSAGSELSLIIFDVDHFKQINDQFGHSCGDDVLKLLCQQIQQELRSGDLLFRIGGEEFAIALPETPPALASQIAERLRLCALALEFPQYPQCHISISLGVSGGLVQTRPWPELLKQADQALYQAKHQGRNRTLCFGQC